MHGNKHSCAWRVWVELECSRGRERAAACLERPPAHHPTHSDHYRQERVWPPICWRGRKMEWLFLTQHQFKIMQERRKINRKRKTRNIHNRIVDVIWNVSVTTFNVKELNVLTKTQNCQIRWKKSNILLSCKRNT